MTINFIPDTGAAPMTPARQRLAYLLKAKEAAAAEVKEAQGRVARLQALANSTAPITATLAALEAEEGQKFALWARGDASEPVPAADLAARTDLQRELIEVQAKADAAARAVAGMSHEIDDANAKSKAAEASVPLAAAVVALEELAPIVEEARKAVAAIGTLRMKGRTLLNELLAVSSAADVTPVGRQEFMAAYAAASTAVNGAFEVPHDDLVAYDVFRASVLSLLTALRTDANAKLGA